MSVNSLLRGGLVFFFSCVGACLAGIKRARIFFFVCLEPCAHRSVMPLGTRGVQSALFGGRDERASLKPP